MDADVEMRDDNLPPQSPTPSLPSPSSPPTIQIDPDVPSHPQSIHPLPPTPSSSTHPPPSTNNKPPSTKPRSSKPHKPRSPSPSPPPPPPPPPPLQTIRLQIKLGGPDNYAVDIADIARATGQRPQTPPTALAAGGVASDSEDDEDDNKDKEDSSKKKKKKKNPVSSEYYDVSDPFIDDSELALDERTWFAQTKQQGFYVSSGEVALLKDKTPKKPKSKNPLAMTTVKKDGAGTSKKGVGGLLSVKKDVGEGTSRDSPTGVPSGSEGEESRKKKSAGTGGGEAGEGPEQGEGQGDGEGEGEEKAGQKRKRYITVVEGGKKRKVVDIHSFHPDLQVAIEGLKQAIVKEKWDQKGKFPPTLKPQLSSLAILAIKLDEYDEHFFSLMPSLFPYNKFTMTKLIRRTVFPEHLAMLHQRQDALLIDLAAQAEAGFSKAEEEWEKSVVAWDKRQEKLRAEAAANPDGAPPPGPTTTGTGTATGTDSASPTRHPTEEKDMDVDPVSGTPHDMEGKDKGEGKDKDKGEKEKEEKKDPGQHPPAKKYRMTESMKAIVWQLVLLSNECCRLENEKNTLEGSVIQVSEQGLRKALYQKIVAAFPDGWMSSGQISRDVSAMKKRFEKEAMENET